jgi:hypothetical protein
VVYGLLAFVAALPGAVVLLARAAQRSTRRAVPRPATATPAPEPVMVVFLPPAAAPEPVAPGRVLVPSGA